MLLPCEDNLLRSITLDRYARPVYPSESLPHDIEHALLSVIEEELAL